MFSYCAYPICTEPDGLYNKHFAKKKKTEENKRSIFTIGLRLLNTAVCCHKWQVMCLFWNEEPVEECDPETP